MDDPGYYPRIGSALLIGMSAKNAILIVEFAKQQRDEVRDRVLHSRRVEPSTLLRRLAASESGGLRARRAPRGVHLAAERHVGVTVARGGGGRSAGGRERSCPASTGRTDGEVGGETGGRRGMVQETRAAGSTSTHGGPRAGSVRVLCRCSRIFLTTGGSVMNEMTRICAPQVHSRGSAS